MAMEVSTLEDWPLFETVKQAKEENEARIDILWAVGGEENVNLALELEACTYDEKKCNSAACKICNREYRMQLVNPRVSMMAECGLDHWMLTVIDYKGAFSHEQLTAFDVRKAKDRLRKQLSRAGFHGPIFGSIELDYHDECKLWLPHAHLIVPITEQNVNAKKALIQQYKRMNLCHIKNNRKAKPLQFDSINHDYHQVSYCFKLSFFEVVDIKSKKGNRYTRKQRLKRRNFCDSLVSQHLAGRRGYVFSFDER
ncbi:hypothetical protein [Thaumasiovibrio subtropicus]|uniref:hypothetical protein n=1 Tax=Thaumasiovibrio subtropicus TaxID=1891207 RepID=UPI000B34BD46|nr:hypothetical protein [Thaumasiovibrio subtropicus]